MPFSLISCFVLFNVICFTVSSNKYSKEFNVPSDPQDYKTLERPFRMLKLNTLWDKAQKKLAPSKLKSLHQELKIQDKEELNLKKLRSDGSDKDGLKEAEIRRNLHAILEKYNLEGHLKVVDPPKLDHPNQEPDLYQVFKDKKLNKLWMKVERAGLTDEELKTLKEEFGHHQEKVDQFYQFMEDIETNGKDNNERSNSIESILDAEEKQGALKMQSPHQMLKEKHREIKSNYDQLNNKIHESVNMKDFNEKQVKQLWSLAQKADFTPTELESLREELKHYEYRIKKLHHMRSELQLKSDVTGINDSTSDDEVGNLKLRIKHYNHKVDKIHSDLESKILQRHSEF